MLLKANASRAGVSCRQARNAVASVRPVRAPLAVRAQKQASAEAQAFEVSPRRPFPDLERNSAQVIIG